MIAITIITIHNILQDFHLLCLEVNNHRTWATWEWIPKNDQPIQPLKSRSGNL
jgi:hypothetical protein